MTIQGNIIDIANRSIYYGQVTVAEGKIRSVEPISGQGSTYILPGFIDAHVHIESSMLVPTEFARLAVPHGTVATISDPHEIANVLGLEGVAFMIDNGKQSPLKFNFGAPSCVPATTFETAGAVIDAEGIRQLLEKPEVKYLAEMMNYPGVLFKDEEVMRKIEIAKQLGKPIDGHAPGLRGEDALNYIQAGISTDHECYTYEEGLDKLQKGMKVIIREGSAAKNFDALIPLMKDYAAQLMFCSDDKHPDDLIEGHINQLVSRAVKAGYNLFDVLQAACLNPIKHYHLDVGRLQAGDPADFIVVENLEEFDVLATYINGQKVAENGQSFLSTTPTAILNNFNIGLKNINDFQIKAERAKINVIKALDGELVTESFIAPANITAGKAISDIEQDILKITVVNRYHNSPPAMAFINGFKLQKGALASCVGHDSHNIIAVGVDDADICKAVNLIIENKGGIAAMDGASEQVLPLPIAGIMTNADGYEVAAAYAKIDQFVKTELGCQLTAPFMTLSFMALLVIPQLKLSDQGLFDGKAFQFTPLFVEPS